MNRIEKHHSLIEIGGKMKRSWLSYLFFSLSIGLFVTGLADAATIVPITACIDCHGTNPQANAAPIEGTVRNSPARAIVGSHSVHNSAATCSGCHVVPTAMNHRDRKVNLTPTISGGTYSKTSTFPTSNAAFVGGTCSGTSCHGGLSPAWGATPTTVATCVKCHGVSTTTPAQYTADTNTAAPGYNGGRSTSGATLATDAKVGAHAVHLAGSSSYSSPVACTECHVNVSTTNSGFTGHMNGASTVDFGTVAKSNSAIPSYTGPNCTATYCHFSKPYSGGGVTYTANNSATWTATTLLTGTPSLAGDCSKCHASPPATTGNHSGVTNINQCNGCHAHVTATGSFNDPSKHINGVVDATSCSSCHGWPPTTNAHTIHIDTLKTINGLGSLPGGFVDNLVCGSCHNVSALTKHAGDATSDGTSRNIYLPTPSTLQTTYQFGASAPSYDKAGTTTCANVKCHFGTSTAWGTPPTAACEACHGYPPVTTAADVDNKHVAGATAVNHIGTGATVNTKDTFVSVHGGCQICHGTQSSVADGTGAQSPHSNYVVATQHATGSINMNGPNGTGTGYNSATGTCANNCHAVQTGHAMTTSAKTITYGDYGSGGDCLSCHATAKGTRSAITTEFGLSWGHKKSGRTAVTVSDCIVCHLEGNFTTQAVSPTYHLGLPGGNIDLRDPDGTLNGGETPITNNSGAAFTFTKYAISYAAAARTTTLGNTIPEVVTVKFCMKCHDANGATNPTARTRNAANTATTGTQYSVFEGVNLGANYTTANGAAAAGGVIDVATQFLSTNSSRHPVGAPNSRAYPYSNRLVAPYNNIGTTRDANSQISNSATPRVKANSVVLVCEDCHTSGTTLLTRTVTAHGSASAFRGTYFVSAPTLCTTCHIAGTSGAYNNTAATLPGGTHGAGSAYSGGTGATTRPAAAMNLCNFCHFSDNNTALIRPRKAQDMHGFNNMYGTTAGWAGGVAAGMRPVAFLRNNVSWPSGFSPRPYTATVTGPGQFNLAAAAASCGGTFAFGTGTTGLSCGSNGHTTYVPGGSY